MVTDATTQKLRDLVAYGLLAVAALYFLSGLSLLFKSEQDSGLSFTGRAGVFGHVFTHPLLVLALFGAVALAVGFGERSKNARVILIAALAIAALSLLFGLITWLSGFGADEFYGLSYGGVPGAGKLVGILLGLANLLLLSLAAFFAFTALRALPKTAKGTAANSWAQGPAQPWQSHPEYGGSQTGYASPVDPWAQSRQWEQQQAHQWGQPPQGTAAAGTARGIPAMGTGTAAKLRSAAAQRLGAWSTKPPGISARRLWPARLPRSAVPGRAPRTPRTAEPAGIRRHRSAPCRATGWRAAG
ncbi:MAG: hypothetical protein WKF82_04945 [Nocardioidaceae bacterium]